MVTGQLCGVSRVELSFSGLVASTLETTKSISSTLITVPGSTKKDTLWGNRHQNHHMGPLHMGRILLRSFWMLLRTLVHLFWNHLPLFQTRSYQFRPTQCMRPLWLDYLPKVSLQPLETIHFCNLHKTELVHVLRMKSTSRDNMDKLIVILCLFLPESQDPCFIESKICYFHFQGLGNCGMLQMPGNCVLGLSLPVCLTYTTESEIWEEMKRNSVKNNTQPMFTCLLVT